MWLTWKAIGNETKRDNSTESSLFLFKGPMKKRSLFLIFLLLLISNPAFAYIGPGMGGRVIIGVIGVIGGTLISVVWYLVLSN